MANSYLNCVDYNQLGSSSDVLGGISDKYNDSSSNAFFDLSDSLGEISSGHDNCFKGSIMTLDGFQAVNTAMVSTINNLCSFLNFAIANFDSAERSPNVFFQDLANNYKKYFGESKNWEEYANGTIASNVEDFTYGMTEEVKGYISALNDRSVPKSLADEWNSYLYSVDFKGETDPYVWWKNSLITKYKELGFSDEVAEKMASQEMTLEKLKEYGTNSDVVSYAESRLIVDNIDMSDAHYKKLISVFKQKYPSLTDSQAKELAAAQINEEIAIKSNDNNAKALANALKENLKQKYGISDGGTSTVGTGTSSAPTTTTTTSSNSGGVSYRYDSSAQSTNSNTGTVSNTVNTQTTVVENTEVLDTNVDSTTSSTVVDKTDNVGSNPVTDIIKDSPSNTLPSDTVTNNNTVVETPSTPTDTSTNTNVNTYTPGNNTTPTYNYNNNYTPNTSVSDSSNVEVAPSTSDTPSTSTDNSSVAGSIAGAIGGSTSKGSVVSKIPTSSEPIKSSSSGSGSNVIPIIAGVGAAAAAGIGAKVYLDRKNNNDNTDSYDGGTSSGIEAEDWSDQSNLSIDYDDSDNQENEYLDSTDDYSYVTEEVEKYSAKDSSDLAEQQL